MRISLFHQLVFDAMTPTARLQSAVGWRWREFADRCRRILRPRRLAESVLYSLNVYCVSGRRFTGLNLGGGDTGIDGLWSIDANLFSRSDVIGSINRIKLRDCSVGMIYCSHVLEHVPRAKCEEVLAEWFRVLRPGGMVYVAVPDMEVVCRLYLDRLPGFEHDQGAREAVELATGVMYGGQGNQFNFHCSGHSFGTLKALLESVGFVDIGRFSRHSVTFCLPPGDGTSALLDRVPVSLNVSARKPE